MERPGIEPPLCAQSTNRRLYAIYSQIPLDNCVTLHRRMTGDVDACETLYFVRHQGGMDRYALVYWTSCGGRGFGLLPARYGVMV